MRDNRSLELVERETASVPVPIRCIRDRSRSVERARAVRGQEHERRSLLASRVAVIHLVERRAGRREQVPDEDEEESSTSR